MAVTDTSSVGFSMVTGGSRTTYATGIAVIETAQAVIQICKERAAKMLDVDVSTIEWIDGEAVENADGTRTPGPGFAHLLGMTLDRDAPGRALANADHARGARVRHQGNNAVNDSAHRGPSDSHSAGTPGGS